MGGRGDSRIMCDKDDGPADGDQQLKDVEHFGACGVVDIPCRFVVEDQRGSLINARAIATRCSSPPDSSDGR